MAELGAAVLWLFGATTWTQVAIKVGVSLALYALTPKPKAPSRQRRGYTTTAYGSAQPTQIIYGQARVGGVRVYDESTGSDNKYLHRIIAFAEHEINSYEEIYIDDQVVTLDGNGNVTSPAKYDGLVTIKKYLGTSTQLADTDLVNESANWTANHRLRGIAYLYIKLAFDQDVFPQGVPEFTATIKGKKVYDPRTTNTVWSDNTALCIRDYLTSDYGLNEAVANIDDTLVSSQATICDETNTLGGETRYTCNGAFLADKDDYTILGDMLTAMGGILWYAQGKWRMKAAKWEASSVDLDEDDLISSITVSPRHSRRDNFNTVVGTFRGAESNWQSTDYPPVTDAAFKAADGGDEVKVDLDLLFTDSSVEARRIARIFLERNRQQISIVARFGLRAFELQPGNVCRITNARFGWTNKEFEVQDWSFGIEDLHPYVDLTLREISSNVFDEVADGIIYEKDNTNLYDPFDVPTVGLSPSSTSFVQNEKIVTELVIDITSSRSTEIYVVDVEYRKNSETKWIEVGYGELGEYRVSDIEAGNYDIRARAINTFGVHGDWAQVDDFVVVPASFSISDVTGFNYNLMDGTIVLSWKAITDAVLSYYTIRHDGDEISATYANATTIVSKVPRPATSVTVPSKPGTYFIRAFSKTGEQSVTAASVVVPANSLRTFTTALSTTEQAPSFSGTKTGTAISGSSLILSSYATAPSSGTYDLTGPSTSYIDTSSARIVRARIDMQIFRKDDTSGLFDNLVGNVDALAGLWDDLTGFTQVNDIEVVSYIRTTTDNPASSPSWSSWTEFTAGEFYGRAFEFRVQLESSSDNVTPRIDSLIGRVEYD